MLTYQRHAGYCGGMAENPVDRVKEAAEQRKRDQEARDKANQAEVLRKYQETIDTIKRGRGER